MSLVYWDTMLFAYLFEGHPEFHDKVADIARRMEERGDTLCTSIFTVGEVLAGPSRTQRWDEVSKVREFFRSSDGRLSKTRVAEFDLSRRVMLTDPSSGGLVRLGEASPAYLASAGNDYEFASGIDSSDGRPRDIPILGSLRARCVGCHGANVGNLFTFSRQDPQSGEIRVLNRGISEHAEYVVTQKKSLESWKKPAGALAAQLKTVAEPFRLFRRLYFSASRGE